MDNQCYGSLFLVDESSFLSGRTDLIVPFAKLIRVPYKLDCFTLVVFQLYSGREHGILKIYKNFRNTKEGIG
jgi:hypothetical protein